MQPIVLATSNAHKVEEMRAIFARRGVPVLGLTDVPAPPAGWREPDETGTTFEQNATIKALAYAAQTGRACLADDSGLDIDALAGRPGVISSHYFNDGRTDGPAAGMSRAERDARNNARVLRELEGVAPEARSARFVCVMAVAGISAPRGASTGQRDAGPTAAQGKIPTPTLLFLARGTFEGRIGTPPRVPAGDNGFGYDPLFLVAPDFARTGAELGSDEKNARSHRARAAEQVAAWIAANATLLTREA
jgi:XTP/dITP diphosphohydrolase